jgi:hypothetical protein
VRNGQRGKTPHTQTLSVTTDIGKRNPKRKEKEMQNMICYDTSLSLQSSQFQYDEKEKENKIQNEVM